MSFYQVAKAYMVVDFEKHMSSLKIIDIWVHRYVMEAVPEKWARSYFPSNRYNIITTIVGKFLIDKMCPNSIVSRAKDGQCSILRFSSSIVVAESLNGFSVLS